MEVDVTLGVGRIVDRMWCGGRMEGDRIGIVGKY